MKKTIILTSIIVLHTTLLFAQESSSQFKILIDLAHGQRFWNDPDDMVPTAGNDPERVKYLNRELQKTTSSFKTSIGFLKTEINSEKLAGCDLLFIHVPSAKYSEKEVNAIQDYVQSGGSLFMVMEADYWSTLEQTNVNDIIAPFEMQYGGNNSDTLAGGYTKAGILTNDNLKITYKFGRIIDGGIPFCFNNQTDEYPFGVYKKLISGGKIIVMGDAMTTLYMTSWEGVEDYQCQEFMQEAIWWLLE